MSLQFEPIDITKKQPAYGQRCNVFETCKYRHWMYAYWCRDPMTGEFYFEEWHAGISERIKVSHWMPEPGKPKPMAIGNTAEPIYCGHCETELENDENVCPGCGARFSDRRY